MPIGTKTNGVQIIKSIDSLDFFDAKRFMAKHGADSLAGQGVIIKSENDEIQKFLNFILKINRFDDLFLNIVEETNYYGRTIITIDKTKSGNFLFSLATPELLQNVSKIEITPFKAILLKRKVVGLQVFFVREEWTTNEVHRSLTVQDQNQRVSNYSKVDHGEVPKDLNVPEYEKHNLGFVPFIEITNKPARNLILGGTPDYAELADDHSVRHIPIHINNGLRQLYKEEILAKSRMSGQIDITELKKRGGIESLIMADAYLEIERGGATNTNTSIMPSSYNGMNWLEPQKQKINLYARGCGYSDIFPTESAQTEAETLYSKDATQRTNKQKRRRYMELLNDLFSKLLVYKGLMKSLDDELPFTIEIKENVIYNQLQLVSFLTEAVNNRFYTQKEAIMIQRDLDNDQQAEELLNEINREADDREQKQINMLNSNQDEEIKNDAGGIGKAGQGEDPDTDKDG